MGDRKYLLLSLLVTLILGIGMNSESLADTEEKQILIVNSFTEEHSWTNNLLKGLLKTINHSEFNTSIHIESFDYKYCADSNLDTELYNQIKNKYKKEEIDLVISTDLRATEFVVANRDKFFKDIPLIFSGITKAKSEELAKNTENIVGLVERPNIEETLKTAINISPNAKNIYVVHDNTERGIRYLEEIKKISRDMDSHVNVETLEDINKINSNLPMRKISKDSIIIGTTLLEDERGFSVSMSEIATKIGKEIGLPIFHLQETALGHGIIGGNVLSPELQGENIGELVLRLFRGEQASDIGFVEEINSTNIFDYNVMKQFDISEKQLPKDSIILNQPYNVYQEYKSVILATLILIIVLLSLIMYLSFNIKKRKQVEDDMLEVNNDLVNIKDELEQIAYYDDITGLPNRDMFYYDMDKKLNVQAGNSSGSIIYFDIDDFRDINDIFGHIFGDLLLIEVANRLKTICRENEDYCKIYRISGDEYLIWLEGKNRIYTENLARQIKYLFSKQFNIKNQEIKVSASIGIVFYPKDSSDVDELFKKVELAMYKAKELGKNRYKIYEKYMEDEISERVRFENNLKEALDKDEFLLNYQPQIELTSRKIVGFESLIRWKSSEYGLVSPAKFIPIAEETGEIRRIGEWIIREACKFSLKINQRLESNIEVSVNISTVQLKQDDFTDMVIRTIDEIGVESKTIGIEVTETALMESFEENFKKLEILKDKGFTIYLDDFGTGYSSLNYLLRLPINTIKIDKSFVDDMMTSIKGRQITDKIIKLAHDMNLNVVAEGVEDENQLLTLKKLDCDIIQGYIFGKPMTEEMAIEYTEENLKYRK